MPKIAIIHIQKIAPGPPSTIAVATPTMFPVPMVAARAVQRLWNWEIALLSFSVWAVTFLSLKIAPIVILIQWIKWVNWKPLLIKVIKIPAMNSKAMPNVPHTMPFTALLMSVIVSTMRTSWGENLQNRVRVWIFKITRMINLKVWDILNRLK